MINEFDFEAAALKARDLTAASKESAKTLNAILASHFAGGASIDAVKTAANEFLVMAEIYRRIEKVLGELISKHDNQKKQEQEKREQQARGLKEYEEGKKRLEQDLVMKGEYEQMKEKYGKVQADDAFHHSLSRILNLKRGGMADLNRQAVILGMGADFGKWFAEFEKEAKRLGVKIE